MIIYDMTKGIITILKICNEAAPDMTYASHVDISTGIYGTVCVNYAKLLVDGFRLAALEHPRWNHLSLYAKKRRTRDKYYRKIVEEYVNCRMKQWT